MPDIEKPETKPAEPPQKPAEAEPHGHHHHHHDEDEDCTTPRPCCR